MLLLFSVLVAGELSSLSWCVAVVVGRVVMLVVDAASWYYCWCFSHSSES
ncbi:hypothetical protein BVRB_9g207210 [Beta vulgaris subsp. vulgaris]|nr:hypothetical protein BVRB_9g207210 [Beta vulgaris subsp. vulgaris]